MTDAETSAPRRRGRTVLAAVLTAVLLLLAGVVAGRLTAVSTPPPADTSAEAGFSRDMQVHHAQAVEMAMLVRDRTDDEAVRRLAYDIATSQAQQAGQMYAWLEEWGLSQAPSEPTMTWMTRPALDGSEHAHGDAEVAHTPGEPMPGLATAAQLDALEAAQGVEAERIFLELMIAHHQGGVEMADGILVRTREEVVLDLADSVVAGQTGEIEYMRTLLAGLPAA